MQKRLKKQEMEYQSAELDVKFPITAPSHIIRGEVSPDLPHVHDCFEIGYCFEGTGIFTVEDKILPYQAGDAVIINNREVHQAVSSLGKVSVWSFTHLNPVSLLAGHISSDELTLKTDMFCGSDFINIIKDETHPGICNVIQDIIQEMRQHQPGFKAVVRSLVFIMLTRLQRSKKKSSPVTVGPIKRENLARISPAIRHIINKFSTNLNIAELATNCYLSEPHFRKIFKSATGLPPSQYITKFRMNAATVILKNSKRKIIQISTDCGYTTLSSFNRSFKTTFNLSPREYRKLKKDN
jgi:AraC-like DNA-binding protein/mannose-6-phosphate isomerase-like protein (cupin superfamily)